MTRTTLNFVIDLISAMVGLGLILTGLIMYFALPPGSRQAALWGVVRHDWGAVHSWLALSVVILMLVHLTLHWRWVCTFVHHAVTRSSCAPSPRAGNLYGIAILIVATGLLTGFVFLSRSSVEQVRGQGRGANHGDEVVASDVEVQAGPGRGQQGGGRQTITGSLTLAEAAALTGRNPLQLKQHLGLTPDTPDSMRLRQIADAQGWSMPELREKISQ